MSDDPIVYLATVANELLAQYWADVLRDDGVRVMVKAIGPGLADFTTALQEHELYVLRSQLPQAEAIVRDLEAEDAAAGDG